MLGHKTDPVTGGVTYNNYFVELPDAPGIGADVSADFLEKLERYKV
jgi:L-alanine-DL-glutamate epimerase-like enolase superfamily enzyme